MTQKQLLDWINEIGGMQKASEFLGVHPATVWRWTVHPERIKKSVVMAMKTWRKK